MVNFARSKPNDGISEERQELLHSEEDNSADDDSDEDLFKRAAKGNVYQPKLPIVTTTTLNAPHTY